MEILGSLLAGLALFFIGVKTVTKNLKETSSRKFRLLLAKWTKNSFLSSLWGFTAGAMTQSSSGVTFILVGLISSGLLTVRAALPLINWANIGTSTLIFFAALDIKMLVLYLVGLGGLLATFKKPLKLEKIYGIFYGVGILFFGLLLLKQSSDVIAESEIVVSFLMNTKGSLILAFAAGAVLRIIAQSSSAVSVIAITMAGSGLFTIEQTMLIIFGTNLGTGISTYFLSTNLNGSSKQIALFQVWLNVIGAVIFVPLLYLEIIFQIPLLKYFTSLLTTSISEQMAYVYLINKLATGFIVTPFYEKFTRLLEKICKPSHEDEISKPQYINEFSSEDPDTALDLVIKEQIRAASYLLNYFLFLRNKLENQNINFINPDSLHNGITSLLTETQNFLTEIINKDLQHRTSERLLNIQNRNSHFLALDKNLHELIKFIDEINYTDNFKGLLTKILEASETILFTLNDTLISNEEFDIDLLQKITSDRGELMEKIRASFLSNEEILKDTDRSLLLHTTNGFEKIVWITSYIAQLIQNDYKKLAVENL